MASQTKPCQKPLDSKVTHSSSLARVFCTEWLVLMGAVSKEDWPRLRCGKNAECYIQL
jgi:hypothetical protein